MAKYQVTFSCGHTETINLGGKDKDRHRKIAYYEEHGLCSKCYKETIKEVVPEGCKPVEMHYGEYKNQYSECKTKPESYNKETKTIVVYVPDVETIKENVFSTIETEKEQRAEIAQEIRIQACEKVKSDYTNVFAQLTDEQIIEKQCMFTADCVHDWVGKYAYKIKNEQA